MQTYITVGFRKVEKHGETFRDFSRAGDCKSCAARTGSTSTSTTLPTGKHHIIILTAQ